MLRTLLVIILGGVALGVSAQQAPPVIIPPTPNVAALAKYGNIPVSTYTGVPDISLPIYTIKSRDISVPVSISYHASGIKVSEDASRIGLGWALNAGGVISRQISNEDDFFEDVSAYLAASSNAPQLPVGPSQKPYPPLQVGRDFSFKDSVTNAITTLALGPSLTDQSGRPCDFQPDVFTYNFAGYSGKFIITPIRKGVFRVVFDHSEKIRISINMSNKIFSALTPDGYQYTFAATEDSHQNGEGETTHITAWYLTRIVSPQGENVLFHYTQLFNQVQRPVGIWTESQQSFVNSNPPTDTTLTINCTSFAKLIPGQELQLTSNTIQILDSIKWSTGNLVFTLEGRVDVQNDKRVKSIQIFSKGTSQPVEEFDFGYDYFQSIVCGAQCFPMPDLDPDIILKRLKLLSLTRSHGSHHEVHAFEYYESLTTEKLPGKNSYARDHWGYYNGKGANRGLIPTYNSVPGNSGDLINLLLGNERDPDPLYSYAYSLKSITYPTLGKTTFTYSGNEYEHMLGDSIPETVASEIGRSFPYMYDARNKAVVGQTASVPFDISDEFIYRNKTTIPVQFQIAFRIDNPKNSGNVNDCPQLGGYQAYVEIFDADTNASMGAHYLRDATYDPSSGGICLAKITTSNDYLKPGRYVLKVFASAQDTVKFLQDISIKTQYYVDKVKSAQLNMGRKFDNGGGIRIASITDYDPSNNLTQRRSFNYNFNDSQGIPHSYGKRMIQPSYRYYDIAWEKQLVAVGPGDTVKVYCFACRHEMFQSDSYYPATGSFGNAVGYDKVIESIDSLTGDHKYGSIEYAFSNQKEQKIASYYPYMEKSLYPDQPYLIHPVSSPTLFNPMNGKLLSQTEFDANGLKLHQVIDSFGIKYDTVIYGLEARRISMIKLEGLHDESIMENFWGRIAAPWNLMMAYQGIHSTFYYRKSRTEIKYDRFGKGIPEFTSYFYDNAKHLQLTKSIKKESNGHQTITTYKYPSDYSDTDAGAVVNSMKYGLNMQNSLVETSVIDSDKAGVQTLLSRDVNVYGAYGGHVFQNDKVVYGVNAPPALASVPNFVPAAGYGSGYLSLFSLDYGADNNINKIQKKSNNPTAFLWGYNKTFPIAEIENALPAKCFYTSFEDFADPSSDFTDGTGKNIARSGKKVFTGSVFSFPTSPTLQTNSNTLMSYSYWDAVAKIWKYSGELPFASTINCTTALDEIRAYPKGSRMSTFTYEPTRGISSRTDHNNVTVYYEYDDLGRLMNVRDMFGNIVQNYLYHVKSDN